MTELDEWIERKHERSCYRPAGTYGPGDMGCHASCTCDSYRSAPVAELRARAKHIHIKFRHPGAVDDCQSPHDVLCKAVWARSQS